LSVSKYPSALACFAGGLERTNPFVSFLFLSAFEGLLMAHGSWLLGVSKKLLKIAIRVFPRPFPFFLAFSRSLALQSAGILDVGRRCVGAWGSPFLWRSLQASCSLRFSSFFPLLFRRLSPFESLSFPLLSLASYGPRLQWTFLLHMQHVARNVACILLLIFEYLFIY
jgi:hypothetical protein